MASLSFDVDSAINQLQQTEAALWKGGKRRILEAGARVEMDLLGRETMTAGHFVTGSMMRSFKFGQYKDQDVDGASIAVYPQGSDGSGHDNAVKAFVIDRGLGGNPTHRGTANKTGDHFITESAPKTEGPVLTAMEAEANRILEEVNG